MKYTSILVFVGIIVFPCVPVIALEMPLQSGVYSRRSKYVQIENKGSRLCYRAFSVAGYTTASLSPDPKRAGFYRTHGMSNMVLKQYDLDTLLIGEPNKLNPIKSDLTFVDRSNIPDDLKKCLSSKGNFHEQLKTRFQRPGS